MFIALIIFVAALFVYSTFVAPEYERVSVLRGEAEAKQQTLDQQRQILDKVSSLLTKYQSIPKLGEVVSSALPSDEGVASAFQQIYTIANASGLAIQQFSANTAIGLKSTKELGAQMLRSVGTAQINLYLIGSYANFKAFLEAMERNIRIMDLAELKIQPAGRGGGDVFLFNLIVNAYYQS